MRIHCDMKDIFNRPEHISKLIMELDLYIKAVEDSDQYGQEGLGNFLTAMMTGSINVLGRISSSVRNVFTRLFKDDKRTDLKFFIDGHAGSIKRINMLTLDQIGDLEVHNPSGMRVTYFKALTDIKQAYATLSAPSNMGENATTLKRVFSTMSNETLTSASKVLVSTGSVAERHAKVVYKTTVDMAKLINPHRTTVGKVSFKKAFANTKELPLVTEGILEFGFKYKETAKIVASMDDIDETANAIVAYLGGITSKEYEIAKADIASYKVLVKQLQERVRYLALLMESYGLVTQNALMLENNYVHVLTELDSHI